MSFVGVIVSMGSFIVIMYMLFPKDKLASTKHDSAPKFRMALFAALGVGISIGIVLAVTNLVPLTLVVVIAVSPCSFQD